MRQIRRKDREMPASEAEALLVRGEYGILSTVDAHGQPYAVPLSFAYRDKRIYFHCALEGHKIENLENNPRVCFCVVGQTRVLAEQFATEYESALAFGLATEARGQERREALLWLLEKYSPGFIEEGEHYIEKLDKATKVIRIDVQQISGKARR
ncbi:MFS transporter [Desulfuromonas versatilis]|uniref:MFS transporter n=1 Tax=Desulfuromonas versatilis TaxID=2802975 RepID=A0ABM8HSB3_9BACT|nr:pyridoxamine 5'-phosphate oxidase family protein [Desulfuromonas versatilis]BCR03332.1 MFS transporter [Desulfuromonas versatilis]